MHDLTVMTNGRPFVRVYLVLVGVVVPLALVGLGVLSVLTRTDLNGEARANCQRSAALANFIRDAVKGNPNPTNAAVVGLVRLETSLRSIGSCPK